LLEARKQQPKLEGVVVAFSGFGEGIAKGNISNGLAQQKIRGKATFGGQKRSK
jgi:hypothetical protein